MVQMSSRCIGGINGFPGRAFFRQKASASPPYLFGSSFASITGSKAAPIVAVPLPTTFSFAKVLAEINGLNNQNIQVMNVGTFM